MMQRAERCVLALEAALGASKVDTTQERREALRRDESETDTVLPIAVVVAQDEQDIATTLRIGSEHRVPVVPRGAGTGRTGGAAVVVESIVLDTTAMKAVKGLERDDGIVIVEPGLVTGELHAMLEREGWFYPPDPQSASWCTLGGNVAENAGGPRAHRYGVTRDYVRGMRVVTMDGSAFAVGRRTSKGVTGYDLTSLLVGSEGTLAVFSELWLRVIARPERIETVLATFDSTIDAGAAVLALARAGVVARCIELLDAYCCAVLREDAPSVLPPHANVVLLIEFDGTERECEAQLERAGQVLLEAHATDVFVARHSGDRERLWASRKVLSRALRARARWKLSEDIVVPRSKLAAMLDEVRTLSERESIAMPTYGHAGDGNLHVNFLWNDPSERPRVQRAIHALFERAIAHGGTLSGEHGIGTLKRDYLFLEQAPALIEAQRSIKRALDPHNLLNPYKVLPAPGHRAC